MHTSKIQVRLLTVFVLSSPMSSSFMAVKLALAAFVFAGANLNWQLPPKLRFGLAAVANNSFKADGFAAA
jgi:hypothetical protein